MYSHVRTEPQEYVSVYTAYRYVRHTARRAGVILILLLPHEAGTAAGSLDTCTSKIVLNGTIFILFMYAQ